MRKSLSAVIITALCLGVFFSCNTESEKSSVATADTQSQAVPCDETLTVLTPLGHPPNIKLKKMAPRLDTLDGKTIYVVDDGFVGGDNLLHEMVTWFNDNYPKTTMVFKRKGGGGFNVPDPQLWEEMKEKADAIIIGLGH